MKIYPIGQRNSIKRISQIDARANSLVKGLRFQKQARISFGELKMTELSAKEIRQNLKSSGEDYSINLGDLLRASEDKDLLSLIVKRKIHIESQEHPSFVTLLNNIIDVSKRGVADHKNEGALKKGRAMVQERANSRAKELYEIIGNFEKEGLKSDHSIAQAMMKAGILSPLGKEKWYQTTVIQIRERVERLKDKPN